MLSDLEEIFYNKVRPYQDAFRLGEYAWWHSNLLAQGNYMNKNWIYCFLKTMKTRILTNDYSDI